MANVLGTVFKNKKVQCAIAALILAIVGALLGGLAGCSVVTPTDAAHFDLAADNAAATSALVQGDANIPAALRRWIAAEASDRSNESMWAHGKKALTPATKPAAN